LGVRAELVQPFNRKQKNNFATQVSHPNIAKKPLKQLAEEIF